MELPAHAETCPQYLFLSYDEYEREGFEAAKFVMSPPPREKWHQDMLWKGLKQNTLHVVATDHCPFCMNDPAQKPLGRDDFSKIPNGAPVFVISRGDLIVDRGTFQGRRGRGQFIRRTPGPPLLT
jgi:dihydropyrimidinase